MILVPGVAAYLGVNTLETSGVASGLAAFAGVMVPDRGDRGWHRYRRYHHAISNSLQGVKGIIQMES